jgi:hypothetical protein
MACNKGYIGIIISFLLIIAISVRKIDKEIYVVVITLNSYIKNNYEMTFEVWMKLKQIWPDHFHHNRIFEVSTEGKRTHYRQVT